MKDHFDRRRHHRRDCRRDHQLRWCLDCRRDLQLHFGNPPRHDHQHHCDCRDRLHHLDHRRCRDCRDRQLHLDHQHRLGHQRHLDHRPRDDHQRDRYSSDFHPAGRCLVAQLAGGSATNHLERSLRTCPLFCGHRKERHHDATDCVATYRHRHLCGCRR